MKRLGKILFVSFCLIAFLTSLTFSQSKETGAIEGVVQTPDGEPLPGVQVTISGTRLIGGAQSRITDGEGSFRFPLLPVGRYEIVAQLEGFNPARQVDLRLSAQMTLTVTIELHVGTLSETAEVIAEAPMIDVKDSQLSTTTMEKEFLTQLPSGRSLRSQMKFAASSVGSTHPVTYGASESLANNFLIDGVKTNSPEAGEAEVNLDYDSVEEMKVMGQGANAEYDGFSGVTVSTITKSGGNQLQGLGTFWFQLPGFHSSNWDNYRDEEGELYLYEASWDAEYDFHLNVGGPFIQDKLWWYLSGKYVAFKQEIEDWDFETEDGYNWRALGKITWQVGSNDRLFGTFDYMRRGNNNIEAGPWASQEAWAEEGGWQYYYNANFLHIFSDRTFLDIKFGGYEQWFRLDGLGGDNPPRFDEATEYLTGNFWEFWEGPRRRTQVNAGLSHHVDEFLGSHDFKFGGEYENSYMRNYRGYPGGRLYLDYDGEPNLMVIYEPYDIEPSTKRYSFFLQDQWTVTDRISINPGIRMNIWRGSTPQDGTIFKPKTGFAPRLGITFDLFGDNSTALKAHYGKYYHGVMGMWFGHWSQRGYSAEYEWNGDEYELLFEERWDEAYQVDPNLKFPYLHNFAVGIERELGRDMSFGVTFIYREHKDFISNVNLSGEWAPYAWTEDGETFNIWQRLNPGENERYVTNPYEGQGKDLGAAFPDIVPFTPTRKYRGLELNFRKRFSNGWQFHASYTYSKAWGSDDNSWGEYEDNRTSSLGSSVLFLNPNWAYNAEGRLTGDYPHVLKLMGSVVLPFEITLGGYFNFQSSSTYNRNIRVPTEIDPDSVGIYSGRLRIYGEEKGYYRLPDQWTFDLRLEKFFTWGESMRLGFLMDMFNVFNVDTVDSVETRIEPGRDPFGFPRGIVGPRTFRFGLHMEF